VLIEIFLPQGTLIFLRELPAGFDSETLDESEEIAAWFHSLREKMEVIGHEAVGMDVKGLTGSLRAQEAQQPVCDFKVQENLFSLRTANSDEVEFPPEVMDLSRRRDSRAGRFNMG